MQNQDGFVPSWSTGVLLVWRELRGYTGIAQGSCPVLGLNAESISLREQLGSIRP